jgi:hypothetical protein
MTIQNHVIPNVNYWGIKFDGTDFIIIAKIKIINIKFPLEKCYANSSGSKLHNPIHEDV